MNETQAAVRQGIRLPVWTGPSALPDARVLSWPAACAWMVAVLAVAFALRGAGGVLCAVFVALTACAPVSWLRTLARRRDAAYEQAIADLLSAVGRSLRSGATLRAAIADAAALTDEPLRADASDIASALRGGGNLQEVLVEWARARPLPAVSWACAALTVGEQTGGLDARLVDHAAAVLRARFDTDAERWAASSQARASAMVMFATPLGFLALLRAVDGEVAHFIRTTAGNLCVGGGLGLDLLALWWMNRVIKGTGARSSETRRAQQPVDQRDTNRPLARPRPAAVVAAFGGWVRRRLNRPGDPVADLRLGAASAVGVVGTVVGRGWGALAGPAVWLVMWHRSRARRREADDALVADVAGAVDLLSVALRAGSTVRSCLADVSPWLTGRLGAELSHCMCRADAGSALDDELERVGDRLGGPARRFLALVVAAERYGAPIVDSLAVFGIELAAERRRAADVAARQVPVRLLFPLIAGVLPAFILLAIVPVVAGAFHGLQTVH